MSADTPTLVVRYRVEGVGHLGRDCNWVADSIAGGTYRQVERVAAKWSHPVDALASPDQWPRPDLTADEKATVEVLALFVQHGHDLPAKFARSLLGIIARSTGNCPELGL